LLLDASARLGGRVASSPPAAGSVSRNSAALISTQWCRHEQFAASSPQELVCSEVRTSDSDQQLVVFTF
jgi:hypothetical protein